MKLSTIIGFLAATAAASLAQDTNQSKPFKLVLQSANQTINDTTLAACHEGAAVESLCQAGTVSMGKTGAVLFNFNTTSPPQSFDPRLGEPGDLTYLLQGSNFNYSESLALFINTASNVALPLFGLGDNVDFAFDELNRLNVQSYVDDTTNPPETQTVKAYYRFYVCSTYFQGYTYEALTFVLGRYPPQNPTCSVVTVKRVFVD